VVNAKTVLRAIE